MEQLGHDEQHKAVVQGGENDRLLAVRTLDRPDYVAWSATTKPSWLGSWPTRTALRFSKPSGPLSAARPALKSLLSASRQVLVIGSLNEFTDGGAANPEGITSFEQYRRSIQDVEVITFDEPYQRVCFIVEDR
ncbi:hypothetical protein [Streptomyces mirabilis]|uniref:hypothetical protein n=1 Tax=Streptomyces mirabilis TaxID=68239 RepID=UPI00333102D1